MNQQSLFNLPDTPLKSAQADLIANTCATCAHRGEAVAGSSIYRCRVSWGVKSLQKLVQTSSPACQFWDDQPWVGVDL